MLIKIFDFHTFIKNISQSSGKKFTEVIAPVSTGGDSLELTFRKINSTDNLILEGYRSIDPLKILLYNIREKVYPVKELIGKRIIAGIKACDMKALRVMDKALVNDNFIDYAYKQWRDTTYIISSDCTNIHTSCNCILVDGKPYTETGCDLNLSVVGDYYLIGVGSPKGEELLALIKEDYTILNSDDSARVQIEENRKRIIEKLIAQNRKYLERGSYKDLRYKQSEIWKESSADCVGCGACTNICPTCYCLILNDESVVKEFVKVRSYDSCQLNGYARVAGGASPRPKIFQRFRNRYLCKFDYMKSNFGQFGCTGCGRCTETCPARIDFRDVIHGVQNYTLTT